MSSSDFRDRHTNIQTDIQTYRQTYRHTDRPSDEAGPRVAFAPNKIIRQKKSLSCWKIW